MESLALLAAIIFLSILSVSLLTLVLIYFKRFTVAAITGVLSIAAGAWWWSVLPTGFPIFALFNICVGLFAVYKFIQKWRRN